MSKLPVDFYKNPTLTVAKELLGKVLVVKKDDHTLSGKIVETEAYIGSEDKACHASWRKRTSCENLWKAGGIVYVYLTYGMHFMLNVVTEMDNFPSAVLIRAVEPLEGMDIMVQNRHTENILNLTSGPAKLTKAFGINRRFDGTSLLGGNFYIEDRNLLVPKMERSRRVGVDYAEEPWKSIEWRFYQSDSPFVSKRK
ncbi:DNA-3-methyladenine glycosylase [Patescibacteria group bacterium]|nr:DNA-3-methyladenine glycosylase [Patescibacteria group bacterium]